MINLKKLLYKILYKIYFVANFGAITGATLPDKSISSGSSWVNYGSFTVPEGAWILFIAVQFSTNNTGYRQFTLGDSSGAAGVLNRTVRIAATPGAATSLTMACAVTGGTYYINVCQNSGSALTVYGRYTAIKVGESFSSYE